MGIYFDNAAAVPCNEEVLSGFLKVQKEFFANQEAAGNEGRRSLAAVQDASRQLAAAFGDPSAKVFWTNTGTDALAWAAAALSQPSGGMGCRRIGRTGGIGGSILTTELEHPALIRALERSAEASSADLVFCPVDLSGALDFDFLEDFLKKHETRLCAFHHVQPETGRIQDLVRIRRCIDEISPETLFLADTIQSAGKIPVPWKEARPDLVFVAGQKIGCPGGAAVVCRPALSKSFDLLRSSEHFPGRCLPATAVVLARQFARLTADMEKNRQFVRKLNGECMKRLEGLPVKRTLPEEASSEWILHLVTAPYQGGILVRMLSDLGVSCSAGSACESETKTPSRALTAMKLPKEELYCALRLSFFLQNRPEEAGLFAEALGSAIRKY